ncbi:hypothetical protein CEXT_458191 [Caerostris extrusa]|uniref:Uncharacterized protein n=1 Tax=Caerostris extrusa TaxID=172846 RepID=A0AAV4Y9R9_CAEEX|nr:hypothetical protein CEXT_458191 [Caerostris extrusa]
MHIDSIRDSTLHSVTAITIEIWHLPRSGFRLPWAGFGKSGKKDQVVPRTGSASANGLRESIAAHPAREDQGPILGKLNFLGVSQRTTLRESLSPSPLKHIIYQWVLFAWGKGERGGLAPGE